MIKLRHQAPEDWAAYHTIRNEITFDIKRTDYLTMKAVHLEVCKEFT